MKNEVYINNALLFSFDDMSKAINQDTTTSYYDPKNNVNTVQNK